MNDLTITYMNLDDLSENPRNARTHSPAQIRQIANSIKAFGFANPLLVDEANTLVAGHGRLAAARQMGLMSVPVVRLAGLSDAQKRGLMLADNKIAESASWDADRLTMELADLSDLSLDFAIEDTGFAMGEIDLILDGADGKGEEEEAEVAPDADRMAVPVAEIGDLWLLGEHRVVCGNARSKEDLATLMCGELADAVFTDPPYNVTIKGHVSGKGAVTHREFNEASGEMDVGAFESFLAQTLGNAAECCRPGAVFFACMDWRHIASLIRVGEATIGDMLNLCVWAKTNGGMGSLYRSQHELISVFKRAGGKHRNNVQLGRFGRNRSNLWQYAGVNTFRAGRLEELHAHPTAKPVAMVRDAFLDVTARNDVVLDTFAGAGATLMAAQSSGRKARLLEIDPLYVDVMLRRWREETGEDPRRKSDGAAFSQVEASKTGAETDNA